MRRLCIAICFLLLIACDRLAQTGSASTTTTPPQKATSEIPAAPTSITGGERTKVTFGLDWTPNTNHTGVYVAQAQGWYRDSGLKVEILLPPEGGALEQLIASGKVDFGISFQEAVTQGRAQDLPIVSIAAVIQHNTSGFASRKELGITSPKDFEGKKFGAYGSAFEHAVINGLMQCVGADANKVEFVEIGTSDFLVATERGQVDFVWIFKGWEGIRAEQAGVPMNLIMLNDLHCIPDYYTPVIITSERMIAERPDVVRQFMQATAKGYAFSISNPDEAADNLLKAVPELDPNLVKASQRYLAEQYQAEAPRWGEQRLEIWRDYARWMADRQLIPRMIVAEEAFTNMFLP